MLGKKKEKRNSGVILIMIQNIPMTMGQKDSPSDHSN